MVDALLEIKQTYNSAMLISDYYSIYRHVVSIVTYNNNACLASKGNGFQIISKIYSHEFLVSAISTSASVLQWLGFLSIDQKAMDSNPHGRSKRVLF